MTKQVEPLHSVTIMGEWLLLPDVKDLYHDISSVMADDTVWYLIYA